MASHPIVHIEIPVTNPVEAAKFYNALFDWKIEHDETFNYTQFDAEGGPGGAFVDINTDPNLHQIGQALIYVDSDDIPTSLSRVEALGGQVVTAETEIPGIGWYAIFTDPSGNKVALYKSVRASS
jgi:uncharacterized protein